MSVGDIELLLKSLCEIVEDNTFHSCLTFWHRLKDCMKIVGVAKLTLL